MAKNYRVIIGQKPILCEGQKEGLMFDVFHKE